MPAPIRGIGQTLPDTLAYHIVSSESAFGIPMQAFGEIVIGFIVFGVALNKTGGGRFFNDLAFALVGRVRGGAAQVGVVRSEEHTSELQSLMRISYAVFCLKKKTQKTSITDTNEI